MKSSLFFSLFLLSVMTAGQFAYSSQVPRIIFINATLIDMTGAPAKPGMSLIIEGDRIKALGKTEEIPIPKNAQVIDATGKFLIPGLWDMHAHIRLAVCNTETTG